MRRRLGSTGWAALVYFVLVNAGSILYDAVMDTVNSGWGYLASITVALLLLLLWKKPRYWREALWARGKPMGIDSFMSLLAIFLSCQLVSQIYVIALELGLNGFGLSVTEGLQVVSGRIGGFSMFLYVGIAAPIAEELLCRGLILRTLMPFGKRFAVFCSAFLFAIFHGNILQTPVAFLVGLVLGYTAAEHSIGWAIVLHMVNNLVLGQLLPWLFPDELTAALVTWTILFNSAVGAVIILICERRKIRSWNRSEPAVPGAYRCFFSSGGVITFTVLMLLCLVATCFAIIQPI